jgi:hypothetical protein
MAGHRAGHLSKRMLEEFEIRRPAGIHVFG